MKPAPRKRSKTISVAAIRAMKARDRVKDWERLARGEVTPEQLQDENAIVRNAAEFRIVNWKEMFRHLHKMNQRHSRRSFK